ncbi:SRPBCC family protein [Sphingomonas profundi]|uniref:SRPBCC family protein n=1 Tax=Alterirhizorhabdus profundi TaxID=2681549 RepID=UPI0012E78E54|nr:SRPBCC domain-containing protein [Sphingomonas profundi]
MATDPIVDDRPTLHIRRLFDAPRALLWAAWTRPEMIVRWLGPVEWPAVSATSDLRVGGRWSATLESADGSRSLRQHGVYLEIVPEERLIFTFRWEGDHEDGAPVDTQVTVALDDAPGGRTRLDFTHAELKSAQSLAGHRHGWESSFGRLDAWLA